MCSVADATADDGDCIKVFARVRPAMDKMGVRQTLCVNVTSENDIELMSQKNPRVFSFDHVADQQTNQETVFNKVGRRIIENCVGGYNGTIFAYGQTGSGKTYTMLGPREENSTFTDDLRGLIPRSLQHVFQLLDRKAYMHGKDFEFICKASFLEIYNEQIFDLLDPASARPLQLREDRSKVFVEGIIERNVGNGVEAYRVLMEGWHNRRVASTSMNRESSRSHAVFTLAIETKEHGGEVTKVRQSVLNLVDLAGSERQKLAQTSGQQLREASNINGSLLHLGHVIMALDDKAHKKERHVPYRDSKLTFLLRDSLGGNAKTYIIINIHPVCSCFGETLSTLQFAQRAKRIRNRARVNENMQGDVLQLQIEIKKLKQKIETLSKTRHLEGASGDGGAQDDTTSYKERFLRAMLMRRRQDRLISALETRIAKMDRALLAKSMVIKLRNSSIASLKNNREICSNEQVASMEEELTALKDQLDHHPAVAAHASKIAQLKNEVERLKSAQSIVSVVYEQEKELEELYLRLHAEMKGDPSKDSSSDGAEKLKIFKLEEQLKQQQAEMEKLRDANSSLEADLKGSKKEVEELEKVLKITAAESCVQRKRLTSMHENTLRIMTTPKRPRMSKGETSTPAIQRGAPIYFEALGASPSNDDAFRNVPLLQDETMPDGMEDVFIEALQEELKKEREQTEKYKEEILQKDYQLVSLRSSQSTVQEKFEKCSQNLSEDRAKLQTLEKEYSRVKTDAEMYQLEVRDLRILLKSADKEHDETKEKFRGFRQANEQVLKDLEEKYHNLQAKSYTLDAEREKSLKEAQTLSVDVENLQMEVDFLNEQLSESHTALETQKSKQKSLEKDFEQMAEKLDAEIAANKSQNMADMIAAKQDEICHLETQLGAAQEDVGDLREELEDAKTDLQTAEKRKLEDKAAIQALMKQVSELRGSLTMQDVANSGLHADIKEITSKLDAAGQELETERSRREKAESLLSAATEEFTIKESKHEFDMENLQEDLIYWSEQTERLKSELEERTKKLDEVTRTISDLQKEKRDVEKASEQQVAFHAEQAEIGISLVRQDNIRLQKEAKTFEARWEEMVSTYMMCKESNSDLKARLEDARNELRSKEDQHMKEIGEIEARHRLETEQVTKKLKQTAESARSRECEAIAMSIETENELKDARTKLKDATEKLNSREEESARVSEMAEHQFSQVQELKEQLQEEAMMKCHAQEKLQEVQQERDKLREDVAAMAGHQNHRQKISYLEKLLAQHAELKEHHERTSLELKRAKAALRKYQSEHEQRSLTTSKSPRPQNALRPKDLNTS